MNTEAKLREILTYWDEFTLPDYVERTFDDRYLKTDKMLTITGPRRAGKTYLCFQLIDQLTVPDSNIVYVNFEDERLHPLNGDELTKLLPVYRELFQPTNGKIYLFLDEIHTVPNWSRWARRIDEREHDVKLVLTGSSAALQPTEIPSHLRGRTLATSTYPFSFKEFLRAKEITYDVQSLRHSTERSAVRRAFTNYVEYGGFPEAVLADERLKLDILQEYYRTIFQRDIVERFGVDNIEAMRDFFKLRMDNFTRPMTFTKSRNTLKSMGHKIGKATLQRYLSHAKHVYLLFDLQRYTPKTKNRMRYPRKIYPIDTGMVNAVRFRFTEDWGRALENIVYIQLRRGDNDLFYHGNGGECDFLVQDRGKITCALQVTADLTESREREIQGVTSAMDSHDLDDGLILTNDTYDSVETEHGTVRMQPVWHWLLKDESLSLAVKGSV